MKHAGLFTTVILFIGISVWLASDPSVLGPLRTQLSEESLWTYGAYVLLLMVAVIFAPVTVMPLIPVASSLFGPFVTAILSVLGWTLGSVGAFLVARYLARPLLERFASMQKIDQITDAIPENMRFLYIILLRLTLPVDLVSYALGLTRAVGLIEYTGATFLGVIWFSFAFAYLGEALLSGDTLLLVEVGGASLLVFLTAWYYMQRKQDRR